MGRRFERDFIAVRVGAWRSARNGFTTERYVCRGALGQANDKTALGGGSLFPAAWTRCCVEVELHAGG